MRKAKISAVSAEQDEWVRRAYVAASTAGKDLVGEQGPIRSNTAIGRLVDSEWGWIASAVIWGWVKTRAEQASSEGWSLEETVRRTELAPSPWDMGSVLTTLPALAEACSDFDWSQSASAWSKDDLARFLLTAFNLIQRAIVARDVAEERLEPVDADETARRINAAAGNSRMTLDELNSDIPF
jgi:hypothetical protein